MPFTFQKSPSQAFVRSPSQARNTPGVAMLISSALAIVPYQGFGTKFNASNVIDWVGYGATPTIFNTTSVSGGFTFDQIGIESTYQKLETRLDWSDGTWQSSVFEYHNYWANGYGIDTSVTTITRSSLPTPSQLNKDVTGYEGFYFSVVTDYGNSTTDLLVQRTLDIIVNMDRGDGVFRDYPYTVVFSAILSKPINYSDTAAQALTLLASLAIPPLPAPGTPPLDPFGSPIPGIYGNERTDIIWPDTATTYQTISSSGLNYKIAAANGMYVNGTAINGGSICADGYQIWIGSNNSFPLNSIFSAKSSWFLTRNPWDSRFPSGKPGPPYNLYFHPLDPSSDFATQSLVNLSTLLSSGNAFYTFVPGTDYVGTPEASDIPPFGFAGAYSPLYYPGGYGEIGFGVHYDASGTWASDSTAITADETLP